MTHVDKGQMKDHMPTSQCTSKDSIYTENWNVRSTYITGKQPR